MFQDVQELTSHRTGEAVSASLGLVACWLVSSLQIFSGLSDLVGDLFPVVCGISVSWWSVEDMFPGEYS